MPFQQYCDTVRSKTHMGHVRLPVLVGLTAIAMLFVGVITFGFLQLSSSPTFEVVEQQGTNDNEDNSGQPDAVPSTILVHVAGAVCNPGVCELTEGARVNDAIAASGGFAEGANTQALNLARVLSDGEQLIVPLIENDTSSQKEQDGDTATNTTNSSGKVNINSATVEELDTLPGVGPSTAQKIVDDRTQNGPFTSVEDLKRVSGIGDKKFNSLSDYICIG